MRDNPFHDLSNHIDNYIRQLPYDEHYSLILNNLVACLPGSVSIKDSTTLSYTTANTAFVTNYGYTAFHEIKGKSVHDMAKKMKKRWPKDYDELVTDYENKVAKSGQALLNLEEVPYVNYKQELVINYLSKIPLLNKAQQVIGILTLALNNIAFQDNRSLRRICHNTYQHKAQALEKFLMYSGLHRYLAHYNKQGVTITNRELDCLILRTQGNTIKEIAQALHLSPRTVEAYLNALRDKFAYPNMSAMLEEFCYLYIGK